MGWSRISPLFSGEPIEQTGNPVARTGPPHSAIAVRPSAKLFRFLTLRSSRSNRRCAAPQHLPPCPDRATIIFIDLDASGASRLAAWPAPSMFLLWTVTPGQVRVGAIPWQQPYYRRPRLFYGFLGGNASDACAKTGLQ